MGRHLEVDSMVSARQLHLGEYCLLPGTDMTAPARIIGFGPPERGGREISVLADSDGRPVMRTYWVPDGADVLRWREAPPAK